MTPPVSDHFNGKTFFQPGAHPERSWRDVLRWKWTSRPARWPKSVPLDPQPPPAAPRGDEMVVTWLGHATFLIQTGHGNFLVDPVFSKRASPVTWAGPKRVHAVPMPFSALPRIDAVAVSHDHYDHCDAATLRLLAKTHAPTFVAPCRHHDLLERLGATRIVELDWWQTHILAPDLHITLTPTKHWSNRLGTPRNHRLWGGFWIRVSAPAVHAAASAGCGRRLWFVGDSGYDPVLFATIRQRLGEPDVALVPIGAYEPRWFMAPMHMDPDEAVRLHRDVGAKTSLAMHWGTFQLTDEAREAPVHALETARTRHGIAPDAFRVLQPGETVVA